MPQMISELTYGQYRKLAKNGNHWQEPEAPRQATNGLQVQKTFIGVSSICTGVFTRGLHKNPKPQKKGEPHVIENP